MRTNVITTALLIGCVVAAGCGRGGEKLSRNGQQQYETVQEGSASGVTSTIGGGTATTPPLTGTNADTTSAFTLDPNAASTTGASTSGVVAGTLPPPVPDYATSTPSPTPSYTTEGGTPTPRRAAPSPVRSSEPRMTSSRRPSPAPPARDASAAGTEPANTTTHAEPTEDTAENEAPEPVEPANDDAPAEPPAEPAPAPVPTPPSPAPQ